MLRSSVTLAIHPMRGQNMKIRITSAVSALVFVLGFNALPARAQGNGQGNGQAPPSYPQLAKMVADLSARVAKLEGNITADDLVGTYSVHAIDSQVSSAGGGQVTPQVSTGVVTLNGDGTGMLTGIACGGYSLALTSGSVSPTGCNLTYPFTWTYANGTLTETIFGAFQVPFSVGVGGRVMTTAFTPFDGTAGDAVFIILTRLQ